MLQNCFMMCQNFDKPRTKTFSSQKQPHSVRIIYNKIKYESVRELLRLLKILNVNQISILNNVWNL